MRGLDEIRRLVRTGVSRVLVILGASGSGKSSFLRAGLWPRLKRDDRAWLPLPIIRPERAVVSGTYGLVQALQQIISEPRFAAGIRQRGLPRNRPEKKTATFKAFADHSILPRWHPGLASPQTGGQTRIRAARSPAVMR